MTTVRDRNKGGRLFLYFFIRSFVSNGSQVFSETSGEIKTKRSGTDNSAPPLEKATRRFASLPSCNKQTFLSFLQLVKSRCTKLQIAVNGGFNLRWSRITGTAVPRQKRPVSPFTNSPHSTLREEGLAGGARTQHQNQNQNPQLARDRRPLTW